MQFEEPRRQRTADLRSEPSRKQRMVEVHTGTCRQEHHQLAAALAAATAPIWRQLGTQQRREGQESKLAGYLTTKPTADITEFTVPQWYTVCQSQKSKFAGYLETELHYVITPVSHCLHVKLGITSDSATCIRIIIR